MSGVHTASWSVEFLNGRTVLLMARFDRDGSLRIPFPSAMSMLGAVDGEHRSYLEIADAIRVHSVMPQADLSELWRRMVSGPVDVSPRFLSTSITYGYDRSASMELAFEAAQHFSLSMATARDMGATNRECDHMASAFEHEDSEVR